LIVLTFIAFTRFPPKHCWSSQQFSLWKSVFWKSA